jgi:hypothetical protein
MRVPYPFNSPPSQVRRLQNQNIRLDWRTISEVNNYGFFVHRANANDSVWNELPNSFTAGLGTTNAPHAV